MSGHSKWSQIKRQKQANDLLKGNIFSKLSNAITLAVLEGGGLTDADNNVKLRLVIEKARQLNMPKENIKRAIEKGTGSNKDQLKEIIYEGFAPYGISLLIQTTTDNPNRTFSEVRNILEKHNGKLGSQGSVSYLFQKCGQIDLDKKNFSEADLFNFAEKVQAFDIRETEISFIVYFPFENLKLASNNLVKITSNQPEIVYLPISSIELKKDNEKQKIMETVEALENLDDVHRVFTNSMFPF